MYKVVKEIRPEEVEMKKTFADTMEEMAAKDDAVVYFDCDVINSIGMVGFGEKYPDRCIDCGIQEANMIGVARRVCGRPQAVHTYFRSVRRTPCH